MSNRNISYRRAWNRRRREKKKNKNWYHHRASVSSPFCSWTENLFVFFSIFLWVSSVPTAFIHFDSIFFDCLVSARGDGFVVAQEDVVETMVPDFHFFLGWKRTTKKVLDGCSYSRSSRAVAAYNTSVLVMCLTYEADPDDLTRVRSSGRRSDPTVANSETASNEVSRFSLSVSCPPSSSGFEMLFCLSKSCGRICCPSPACSSFSWCSLLCAWKHVGSGIA